MRRPANAHEREIIANIKKHGWFCMSVYDPDGAQPPFVYSVGFTETLSCPEFIIVGLDPNTMHAILWETFRTIKDGKRPADGQTWPELLENYNCVCRAVHAANVTPEHFASAIWFWSHPRNKDKPMQAFQIVWPDRHGLFPWDADCDASAKAVQTPLYMPPLLT